jgi:hypothetical protein
MLAGVRFFLFSSLLAISFAMVLPSQAQTNGVPPSVTSMGFGGKFINGVSPSVISLGSGGYGNGWSVLGNCCANFFWPVNPHTGLGSGRHHHKRDDAPLVGVVEPIYVPYAAADAAEDDEDAVDEDPGVGSGRRDPDAPIAHAEGRDAADKTFASARSLPQDSADLVPAQISTALVFKDGHRSEVFNYAIAGDTLFDFDASRSRKIPLADIDVPATRKANDDRGVDFQIPVNPAQ